MNVEVGLRDDDWMEEVEGQRGTRGTEAGVDEWTWEVGEASVKHSVQSRDWSILVHFGREQGKGGLQPALVRKVRGYRLERG